MVTKMIVIIMFNIDADMINNDIFNTGGIHIHNDDAHMITSNGHDNCDANLHGND